MKSDLIKVMKLNVLDTHDRLLELKKTEIQTISKGCEDCLKKNPDSLAIQEKMPYIYIFAHPRTTEDGNSQRLLWQPRISRPSVQSNSYCFRAKSKSDTIEVCWMIPKRELWDNYSKGKVTHNEIVEWSINMYQFQRDKLQEPHPEDWSEEALNRIFLQLMHEKKDRSFKPDLPDLA